MQQLSSLLEKALVNGGWWGFAKKMPDPVPACEACGQPVCIIPPVGNECLDGCKVVPQLRAHGPGPNRWAVCRFCRTCCQRLSDEYEVREIEEAKRDPIRIRSKARQLQVPEDVVPALVAESLEDRKSMLRTTEFCGDTTKLVLVLAGGHGLGKSWAAAWALWEHQAGGLYVSAAQLGSTSIYNEEKWERLLRMPLLVVDDFGSDFVDRKTNGAKKLEMLICDRVSQKRQTILTTNLSPSALTWSPRLKERFDNHGTIADLGGGIGEIKPQGDLGLGDKEEPTRQ